MVNKVTCPQSRSTLPSSKLTFLCHSCTSTIVVTVSHRTSCSLRVAPAFCLKEALSRIVHLSGFVMYKNYKKQLGLKKFLFLSFQIFQHTAAMTMKCSALLPLPRCIVPQISSLLQRLTSSQAKCAQLPKPSQRTPNII